MNEIRKRISLAAPVERVWAFLTEPSKMADWLMESNLVDVEEGREFMFTAEPAGSWDGKIYCTVHEIIENERISYTWNANDINQATLVTFDLEPVRGGTELVLTHANLEGAAPGAPGRHAAGWTNCFKRLRSLIEGESDAYDWSQFTITYLVDSPIEDIYALWSTSAGMRRFWGDDVTCHNPNGEARGDYEEFANGDRIHIRFPTDTETSLEILNIETNRFVLFSFGEDYGWVRVMLSVEGTRTAIELTQFGLPTGDDRDWNVHANARGWWIANLANIKSVLKHGNDLRVRGSSSGGLGTSFSPGGNNTSPHDWSAFDIYLQIDATTNEVASYWQTPGGLEQFFIAGAKVTCGDTCRRKNEVIEAQDSYTWRFIHPFEVEGRFLDVSPTHVSFTFGSEYTVEVNAMPSASGTLLHLHQAGMRDTPKDRVSGSLNCRSCWILFMVNLKSVIEHGVDLRDQNPETTDSISVGYNR